MKIFLTGDNHVGLKYASHTEASVLREKRISAFPGMVAKANEENCDLFVVAGDLFENTYSISQKDIKTLLGMLSRFMGTVVVLPGNHDYYDTQVKVWQQFENVMQSYDNIMLLKEYKPYRVVCGDSEAVLFPALCTSLHSSPGENNLGWIKAEEITPDETIRIGIAHGAVQGETIDSEGAYFLMKREELESIPVDVWLIGHTHVPFPDNLREETFSAGEKIFNAGSHVQTDVSCNTDGECFIIDIAPDKTVKAKKFRSGNLRFYRRTLHLSAGNMEDILADALREYGDDSVVDLILTGAVSAEEYEDRHQILENALSRFIEGTYDDSALSRLITRDLIDAEFPETSFSAGFLKALLEEPKEAQLAYDLLRSLKGGK